MEVAVDTPSAPGSGIARVGAGGGGEVEVVVGPAEHRVADRPTDQRELEPLRRERVAERLQHRREPVQLVGHGPLDVGDAEGRELGLGHGGTV